MTARVSVELLVCPVPARTDGASDGEKEDYVGTDRVSVELLVSPGYVSSEPGGEEVNYIGTARVFYQHWEDCVSNSKY